MPWIRPIEMNMDISRAVLERKWSNPLLALAQEVVIATRVPFLLIAYFEAIVKNLICINVINFGISLLNGSHALYKIAVARFS